MSNAIKFNSVYQADLGEVVLGPNEERIFRLADLADEYAQKVGRPHGILEQWSLQRDLLVSDIHAVAQSKYADR